MAACENQVEILRFLLQNPKAKPTSEGTEIFNQNSKKNFFSGLFEAVCRQHKEVVDLLISHRFCQVNSIDTPKKTSNSNQFLFDLRFYYFRNKTLENSNCITLCCSIK